MLFGALGTLGLVAARRVGFPGVVAEGAGPWRSLGRPALVGLAAGLAIVATDRGLRAITGFEGFPHPPFPASLLASATAGIGEELIFRLFLMSVWAVVLAAVLRRPRRAVAAGPSSGRDRRAAGDQRPAGAGRGPGVRPPRSDRRRVGALLGGHRLARRLRLSRGRPAAVVAIVVVAAVGWVTTVSPWVWVHLSDQLPAPSVGASYWERSFLGLVRGLATVDAIWSNLFLAAGAIGLCRMRAWGWTAMLMGNAIWLYTATFTVMRDLYVGVTDATLFFLPFTLFALGSSVYLWRRRGRFFASSRE